MRIIKVSRIREYMEEHSTARAPLEDWLKKTLAAEWADFNSLRGTFPKADQVKVASSKTVIVFNVGGNSFRLIAAVHFRTGIVFVLRFMTHAQYSKDAWKDQL